MPRPRSAACRARRRPDRAKSAQPESRPEAKASYYNDFGPGAGGKSKSGGSRARARARPSLSLTRSSSVAARVSVISGSNPAGRIGCQLSVMSTGIKERNLNNKVMFQLVNLSVTVFLKCFRRLFPNGNLNDTNAQEKPVGAPGISDLPSLRLAHSLHSSRKLRVTGGRLTPAQIRNRIGFLDNRD